MTGHYGLIGNRNSNLPANDIYSNYLQNQYPRRPLKFKVTNVMDKVEFFLHDDQMKKEFFSKLSDHYTRTKQFTLLDLMYYKGLIYQEGKEHRLHRKVLGNFFHFQSLQNSIGAIQNCGKQLIQNINEFNNKTNPNNEGLGVMKQFKEFSGNAVSSIFLGSQILQKNIAGQSIAYYVCQVTVEMMGYAMSNPWVNLRGSIMGHQESHRIPEFLKTKQEKLIRDKIVALRNVILEEINQRIASYEDDCKKQKYHDLLALYLNEYLSPENQKLTDSDNLKITLEIILQQYITFIFAGTDTTGILISTSMFHLSKYPEIQEKIRQECLDNIPDLNNIQLSQIKKLKTLEAFFNETLRLTTIVGQLNLSVATKDHLLGELAISKGDLVNVSIHGNHNNPLVFKNPEKFDISRWENIREDNISPFDFMPFSAGAKNCIGQHLARIEAKIAMAYLLRNFKIGFKDGDQELVMDYPQLNQLRDDKIFMFTSL